MNHRWDGGLRRAAGGQDHGHHADQNPDTMFHFCLPVFLPLIFYPPFGALVVPIPL